MLSEMGFAETKHKLVIKASICESNIYKTFLFLKENTSLKALKA